MYTYVPNFNSGIQNSSPTKIGTRQSIRIHFQPIENYHFRWCHLFYYYTRCKIYPRVKSTFVSRYVFNSYPMTYYFITLATSNLILPVWNTNIFCTLSSFWRHLFYYYAWNKIRFTVQFLFLLTRSNQSFQINSDIFEEFLFIHTYHVL